MLSVIYLVFTEGSSATSGSDWIRLDLAREAVRVARILARLVPEEPETNGLLALMELTAARFPARVSEDGEAVLLENQDRRRWNQSAIRRGRAARIVLLYQALGQLAPSPIVELNKAVAVSMAQGPEAAEPRQARKAR